MPAPVQPRPAPRRLVPRLVAGLRLAVPAPLALGLALALAAGLAPAPAGAQAPPPAAATPTATPPPHLDGLAARIAACAAPAPGGAYACTLQVTLGAALPVDTVLRVATAHGFVNPSGTDRPLVTASPGCATLPLPSPYLAGGAGAYRVYDLNVSSGGCAPGAAVTIEQAVAGAAGDTLSQAVFVQRGPDLGVAFANAVLPPAGAAPAPAAPAPRPPAPAAAPAAPPAGGVTAEITACAAQGAGYACTLRVTLGAPQPVNTVFAVTVGGATFAPLHASDRPQVTAASGCATAPLPSPYLADGAGAYPRYDLNVSTGGCAAGATFTVTEAVAGAPGATLTQTVAVPGLAPATATYTLPAPAAPPAPSGPARAADGQHLGLQPASVQAAFVATHGAAADARWVAEHEAELGRPAP